MPCVRPVVALLLLAPVACDSSSGPEEPVPATIEISAPADTLRYIGATLTLAVVVRDRAGAEIPGARVQWVALDPGVVGLDAAPKAIAVAAGAGRVSAASGAAADTVTLVVAPSPARVIVSPPADTLTFIGDSVRLSATVHDAGGTPVTAASVTWTSSGPSAVSVTAGGLARALAPGAVQVTARSGEAVGTSEILVRQIPASLRMPPGPLELPVGATTDVSAAVLDAAGVIIAGVSVGWSARNDAVATVTAEGRVRGLASGTTWLVASSGALRDSLSVKVVQVVASVRITPVTDTVRYIGATLDLTAVARDPDGAVVPGAKIEWRALQPAIASVNAEGRVTAHAAGSARVAALSGTATDTATVTVVQVPTRVSVTPLVDTLAFIGDTVRLAATVVDHGGTAVAGASVTWGTSSEGVASVSASGLVSARANGAARITATAGAATGTADVVVRQVATTLRMPAGAITVPVAVETDVVARVLDAGGTAVAGASAAWASRNASVATTTLGGHVRGVAVGSTWLVAAFGALSDSVVVTVVQRLAALSLRPVAVELAALGDTAALAVVGFDDAGQPYAGSLSAVWTIADSRVATSLGNGRFRAVANGATRVGAEAGGLTASADLVVRQRVVAVGVALGRDTLRALGDTTRASAVGRDARGHAVAGRDVTWTSSSLAVASVQATSGVVTAVAPGQSWVVASVDGVRDSLRIVVHQKPASVEISGDDRTIMPGDRVALSAVVKDARGSPIAGLTPTWTSSAPSVALVDAAGTVTGVALGDTRIAAALQALKDSIRVRVSDLPILYSWSGCLRRTDLVPGEGRQILCGSARAGKWSPDGGRIAYLVEGMAWGALARLYVANADGSDPRQITTTVVNSDKVLDFAWSPDGSLLLFENGRHEVRTVPATGGTPIVVARPKYRVGDSGRPFRMSSSWSPDGAWILYDDSGGLVRIRPDGSEQTHITSDRIDRNARWSPRGDVIAFECRYQDICLVRPDGTGRRFLTDTPSIGDLEPVWSPDGTKLAIMADRAASHWELVVIDAETGADLAVFRTDQDDIRPSWSPDGMWIAFESNLYYTTAFLANVRTGEPPTWLTNGAYPDWRRE